MSILDANEIAVWLRPSFYTSPAISQSIDAALKVSCLKASDIDLFDLYS